MWVLNDISIIEAPEWSNCVGEGLGKSVKGASEPIKVCLKRDSCGVSDMLNIQS